MASNRKAIKREDLRKALKDLEELLNVPPEPKPVVTAGEAVRELAPILRKLRRKGHSSAKISQTLAKVGIAIGSSTLNSYLRRSSSIPGKGTHDSERATPATAVESGEDHAGTATGGASTPENRKSDKPAQAGEDLPTKPKGSAVGHKP